MPAKTDKDLASLMMLNRDMAMKIIEKSSNKHLLKILQKAEKSLQKRIEESIKLGDYDNFTKLHLQLVLSQLREVMRPMIADMKGLIINNSKEVAKYAAIETMNYVREAEKKYRGNIDIPILRLREAMILDNVVNRTESSQLRRLMTSGEPNAKLVNNHPGKAGILQRYGSNVVSKFEEILQQRMLTNTHWETVKKELIKASPFLMKKEPGIATKWAERILRTEAMYANNAANLQTINELNEDLEDMVKILAATFDFRTGADSIAVHGQIRYLHEPFESWYGFYMSPPNRPNDREIVVPHRLSWPLPIELKWRSDAEIQARWILEKRTKPIPPRPKMTTIPLSKFASKKSTSQ